MGKICIKETEAYICHSARRLFLPFARLWKKIFYKNRPEQVFPLPVFDLWSFVLCRYVSLFYL